MWVMKIKSISFGLNSLNFLLFTKKSSYLSFV
nr:MAG TPA: hypothetical protein [Caudoviricetes sp.]DAZ46011.1 MAG TPA: hypothetical protein [Caudoviricetes sp.]